MNTAAYLMLQASGRPGWVEGFVIEIREAEFTQELVARLNTQAPRYGAFNIRNRQRFVGVRLRFAWPEDVIVAAITAAATSHKITAVHKGTFIAVQVRILKGFPHEEFVAPSLPNSNRVN